VQRTVPRLGPDQLEEGVATLHAFNRD